MRKHLDAMSTIRRINLQRDAATRFIRDKTFRKAMIELGRSEKIIIEMYQLQAKTTLTKPPEQKLTSTVATGGFAQTW